MSATKTYVAEVLVRPGYCTGPEHIYELTVEAPSEHIARQLILHAVLSEEKLVSRFLHIRQEETERK